MEMELEKGMLVFTRAGAFLSVFPLFSATNIPVRVRLALAAALTILVAPGLAPLPEVPGTVGHLTALFASEMAAGLAIGFVARMVFYAVDFGGRLVANEMGLSLGSVFDPYSNTSTQAPAMVLFYLAAMLMFALNVHHVVLAGFQRTYDLLPIGGEHASAMLFYGILGHTSKVFIVAIQIAAPLMAISFLVMLVFTVLGRAVPQMNVFSESFAVRIVAGMLVFALTLELAAQHIINYLKLLPEDMLRVAQSMGAA